MALIPTHKAGRAPGRRNSRPGPRRPPDIGLQHLIEDLKKQKPRS